MATEAKLDAGPGGVLDLSSEGFELFPRYHGCVRALLSDFPVL